MKFSALLSNYNILSILGLEGVSDQEKANILLKTSQIVLQNVLTNAQNQGRISEEELKNLLTLNNPTEVQNKIIEKLPNFKELIDIELTKLKHQALLKQVQDLQNISKQKVGDKNTELQKRIDEICQKLIVILQNDEVEESDQTILDNYFKIRKSLNFEN